VKPDTVSRRPLQVRTGDAPRHRLEPLFQPRSVCIVGASDRPGSLGKIALDNLRGGGFAGAVSLVNRRHDQVAGEPCRRRIRDLPEPPELAVLAVPARVVAASLRDLAAVGTCHAVMLGTMDLPAEQREELRLAREATGIRLLGPRSLGLARPAARLNLTVARPAISAGSIAIVSQSSAVCAALLDFAEGSGIGLSLVVATGGGIDIDVSDVLDYLSYDASTRSIAVYLEGVRDARRLLSTLRAVARNKPVIVLKGGQNDIGSRSLLTHTDALASDHRTFRSAMRRCGAVAVDSFGELFSAVEWLDHGRRVKGDRLAIVTNGGGLGVLAADACRRHSVDLATLGEATIAKLAASLPPTWSGGNPVNVMPDATPQRIAQVVNAVADDPQADAVLALFHPSQAADSAAIAQALLAQPSGLPTMYAFVGAADARHGWDALNRHGHSVFKSPEDAVRAFSILVEYHRSQRNLLQVPATRRVGRRFDESAVDAAIAGAIATGQPVLDEVRSKQLLAACGIPVPVTLVARTIEEAVRLADRVGYPLVMKVISPDVTHKSDVGGVRLDIRDKLELRGAATAIQQRLRIAAPAARFEGFALQPMIRRGHALELLVGVSQDPAFGPVITFGAGGIAVEVTADAATALPPLNSMLARDLIAGTRVSRLLGGYRHLPPADLEAIADVLVAISALVCRFPAIQALDINPLLASADGVMALDARIVLDPARPPRDSRYRHLAIHPYPCDLEKTVTLATPGADEDAPRRQVLLRPIQPDDAQIEVAFFDRLSAQTRQWRFLHPIKALTPEMVARFTQVDYDRDMALVALPIGEGGEPDDRIIGVARYVREVDDSRCEFAIVVDDEWHGQGLARRMLTHLIAHARTVGLRTMVGYVHLQNLRMLRFMRAMGFTLGNSAEEPSLKLATLQLSADDRGTA
jgi:acetyltransferase